MKNIIKKLNIDIKQPSEEEYNNHKRKYIAGYTECESRFLFGGYVSRPDVAKAKWEEKYPKGYNSWLEHRGEKLTSFGQKLIVEKIDEIIDFLNNLKNEKNTRKKNKRS